MDFVELFLSQLSDPFRIGLLVALVVTMLRTRAVTGTLLPMAAGVLFVAVIIPLTFAPPAAGETIATVAVGVVSNIVLLAVILGIREIWLRMRG